MLRALRPLDTNECPLDLHVFRAELDAVMMEEYNEKSRERLVAMYDFDPSAVDWPYQKQRPLMILYA